MWFYVVITDVKRAGDMMKKYLKSNFDTNIVIDNDSVSLHPFIEKQALLLKDRRHAEYFDIIGSSLKITTPEQFCAWAQGDLQYIFPHEMLVCGLGLVEKSDAKIHQLITCNFPDKYIQNLNKTGKLNSIPVLLKWVKTKRPVLIETSAKVESSPWLEIAQRYGIENLAAHGQNDFNSTSTSYFCFSNIPGKLTPRHAVLLNMLIPHLHVALVRALKGIKIPSRKTRVGEIKLTGRQSEILRWLGEGKTNWEIAQVLKISEHTVKNHVQRILIKLKVNTRAQAVAKVMKAK